MDIEGWPALLAFLAAAALVGTVMWLGATGRIGNGKSPMNRPEIDPRHWND